MPIVAKNSDDPQEREISPAGALVPNQASLSLPDQNDASAGERDASGRFSKGHQVSVGKGRPPGRKVWKDYSDRSKELMEEYTPEQILEMVSSKKHLELPTWDAIILQNIAGVFSKQYPVERAFLLNYVEGGPKQRSTVTSQNPDGSAISPSNTVIIEKIYVGKSAVIDQ